MSKNQICDLATITEMEIARLEKQARDNPRSANWVKIRELREMAKGLQKQL